MIVPVKTLLDELSSLQPSIQWGQITTVCVFRPLDHGVEHGFSSDALYVGSVSQLPEQPPRQPCCYALRTDRPLPQAYLRETANTYILFRKQSSEDIYQLISGVFENQVTVGLLSAELLQSVKRHEELTVILQKSHSFIQIPLILTDRFFNTLCRVGTEGDPPAELIQQLLDVGQMQHAQYPDLDAAYEVSFYHDCLMIGRISRGGAPAAYLIGRAAGPKSNDRLRKLFQVICNFLELRVQNEALFQPDSYSSGNLFLHQLLQGVRLTPQDIRRKADQLGLRLHANLCVIAVERKLQRGTDDQMHMICMQLRPQLPCQYYLVDHGQLLFLYDTPRALPLSAGQTEALQEILARLDLIAVMSLPFYELDEFPAACRQAAAGLSVLRKSRSSARLVPYQALLVDHMLLEFGKTADLGRLIPRQIWELYQMKDDRQAELLQTLFAFADHRFQIADTAKALHIHYNTLKYRLQRIEELTGLDLSSAQTVMQVLLIRRILEG